MFDVFWRAVVCVCLLALVGVGCVGREELSSDIACESPQARRAGRCLGSDEALGTLRQANVCGPGTKQEPDTRSFSSPVEAYASYDGQSTCSPSAKPGMVAFRDLVLKTYPCTGDYGISRACNVGGKSEHKEGRAWDWKIKYPHPAADALFKWLLATRNGVPHAYARRLGLMYMIWNRKIWKSYQASKGWQRYTGSNPHTDHVHFSFSRAGGNKQVSFWGGRVEQTPTLDAKFIKQGAKGAAGPSGGAQFSLCPGQAFSFYFEVQNTGRINWTDINQNQAGRAVRLGFRKGTTFGAPTRISVNAASLKDVQPGASVTFTIKGTAPMQPGVYKSEWQLVSELVKWFGPTMELSFSVTATPPKSGESCQLQGTSGACGKGVLKCTAKGLACVGDASTQEVCDNKDNDCNGQIDDGLRRACYGGTKATQDVGKCRSGTQTCVAGKWGACEGEIGPDAKETCGNTIDDDCDGQIDEGCGDNSCEDKDGDGYGVGGGCPGERDCDDRDPKVYPGAPDICDNGKDDDCRGGDRPCQNTLPEPPLPPPDPVDDAGTLGPDERLKLCPNPPCDGTPGPDKPRVSLRPQGYGCHSLPFATASGSPLLGLLLLCLTLLVYTARKR